MLMPKTRKQTAADRGRPNPIVPPPRGRCRGHTATLQAGRGLATAVQATSGQTTLVSPELPSTGGGRGRGRGRGRGAPSSSGSRVQEPGHDFGADDWTPPGEEAISMDRLLEVVRAEIRAHQQLPPQAPPPPAIMPTSSGQVTYILTHTLTSTFVFVSFFVHEYSMPSPFKSSTSARAFYRVCFLYHITLPLIYVNHSDNVIHSDNAY